MAAAGECVVGISFGYAGLSEKKKGAPVEVIFPAEGSGWDLEANALMKKPEIKPAARTFLDWAVSDSAMELYRKNYPIITIGVSGGYEGYKGDPVKQLIDNDFAWAAGNRDQILKKWSAKFDAKSASK
jgi:iron(III) transport system substrate-binding protein